MKICIIYPPFGDIVPEIAKYASSLHLGPAYIASVLLNEGFDVTWFDCIELGMSYDILIEHLSKNKYDAVGLSISYEINAASMRVAKYIKNTWPNTFIFAGGYLPTMSYSNMSSSFRYIDCLVIGEGELTAVNIMKNLKNNSWKNIKGIAYLDNSNEIIYTGECDVVHDLDEIPFPIRFKPHKKIVSMITSRGCYGSCSFCSVPSFYKKCGGKHLRRRSPHNVFDEIQSIVDETSIDGVSFYDNNFAISSKADKEWFDEFYNLIVKSKLKLQFSCMIRANEVTANIEGIKRFAEIGLSNMFLGIESFLQSDLDLYGKKMNADINIKALNLLDEWNIPYQIGYILFNPFTTLEKLEETVNIFKKINFNAKQKTIQISIVDNILIANRGTEIYDYLLSNNFNAKDERGYIILDKKTEYCYKIAKKWSERISSLYHFAFIHDFTKNKLIKEKLKQFYYELFFLDVDVLSSIIEKLRITKDDNLPSENELLEKWDTEVLRKRNELKKLFTENPIRSLLS